MKIINFTSAIILSLTTSAFAGEFLQQPVSIDSNVIVMANIDGKITSHGGNVQHIPNAGITYSLPHNNLGNGSVLEFNFIATDYFSNNNGHLAVGLRGSIGKHLEGNGIVIGDVTKYQNNSGECSRTSTIDNITFESMWEGGNCVFGERQPYKPLENGVLYAVRIKVDDRSNKISYDIVSEDGNYQRFDTIHTGHYKKSKKGKSFFIGTVPDKNTEWSIMFGDVRYYNFD